MYIAWIPLHVIKVGLNWNSNLPSSCDNILDITHTLYMFHIFFTLQSMVMNSTSTLSVEKTGKSYKDSIYMFYASVRIWHCIFSVSFRFPFRSVFRSAFSNTLQALIYKTQWKYVLSCQIVQAPVVQAKPYLTVLLPDQHRSGSPFCTEGWITPASSIFLMWASSSPAKKAGVLRIFSLTGGGGASPVSISCTSAVKSPKSKSLCENTSWNSVNTSASWDVCSSVSSSEDLSNKSCRWAGTSWGGAASARVQTVRDRNGTGSCKSASTARSTALSAASTTSLSEAVIRQTAVKSPTGVADVRHK